MKFQINRFDFSELVSKIQNIVPAKPSIPILGTVLIEASHDQITLSATDLTVSIRVHGSAKISEEGSIALPARRLFQLVRELTNPEVEIETISAEVAIVHAGSSHFRIQGMNKAEFPTFSDLSQGIEISYKSEQLKEMLVRTSFAAARDDSRPALNGIYLQKSGMVTTFVGTDGKRLARNRMEIASGSNESGSYILPIKAVEEMVKLLDEKNLTIKLTFMNDRVALEVGSTLLIAKLLSGQYPDVSRVIPQKTEKAINLHREELIALLRQVSLFTSEGSHSVRFSFGEGSLHLSAMNAHLGEGKVSMPVNWNGPKLEIAFNPFYLLDILRHTKDETVQFEVSDSYNPGLVTDSSKAEFVIMPMRLEA